MLDNDIDLFIEEHLGTDLWAEQLPDSDAAKACCWASGGTFACAGSFGSCASTASSASTVSCSC